MCSSGKTEAQRPSVREFKRGGQDERDKLLEPGPGAVQV